MCFWSNPFRNASVQARKRTVRSCKARRNRDGVRGTVVQHRADLLMLRIGIVEFLQEGDEVAAFVRVADGFSDSPTVQVHAGQQRHRAQATRYTNPSAIRM